MKNRTYILLFLVQITVLPCIAQAQLQCITRAECLERCPQEPSGNCVRRCNFANPEACGERTFYYCPYNTFASDFNFAEISSNTTETVTGEVRYYNSEGASLTTADPVNPVPLRRPFELSGFSRFDVDIHSRTGQNAIGQAVIVIDGDVDTLSIGISYYKQDGVSDRIIQRAHIPCTMRQTDTGDPTAL